MLHCKCSSAHGTSLENTHTTKCSSYKNVHILIQFQQQSKQSSYIVKILTSTLPQYINQEELFYEFYLLDSFTKIIKIQETTHN